MDKKAQKIKTKSLNGYEKINKILYYWELLFLPKIIKTELISQHNNNFLAGQFGIDKTKELISWKYYWTSLGKDVEAYINGSNIC